MHVIAFDWSGIKSDAQSADRIWRAEVAKDGAVLLDNGLARSEIANYLVEQAAKHAKLTVGFDFAFSMPKWFLEERGFKKAIDFWPQVKKKGQAWLSECELPFYGRPGKKMGSGFELFRETEERCAELCPQSPKSVFQLGGGGVVGPGSIRGMPILAELRAAGFCIWPFEKPKAGQPTVVEIYPRLFSVKVNKRNRSAREGFLGELESLEDPCARLSASQGEDQFDALVSALTMRRSVKDFESLRGPKGADIAEGRIWMPTSIVTATL